METNGKEEQMARQRGSIKKRRETGNYQIRVGYTDADGKRRTINDTRDTLAEAKARRTEIVYQLDNNEFVESDDITVKQWCDEWLRTKNNLQDGTKVQYENRLRLDVYEYVGSMKVQSLDGHKLRLLFGETLDGERGLSARTRQYTYMILNQALDYAVVLGKLKENPLAIVERPKVEKRDKVHKVLPLTKAETKTFLASLADREDRFLCLFQFLLTTGVRPSEALALKWQDVDLDKRTAKIDKALSKVENKYVMGDPKTGNSYRTIILPRETVELLKVHKAEMAKYQMIGGWRSDLVFCNRAGNIQDMARVRSRWNAGLRKAGLEERRLYDARHTHATHMLNAGVSPKVAADRLGHGSTQMFLDVYTHLTDDAEDPTEAISAALYG